jgi:beta-N-acetylhexosaminidase
MAGASAGVGIPEASVRALAAGCDLLCLGPDKPASLVTDVRDAIVAAVEDGRLAPERLAEAARRVRTLRSGTSGQAPQPGEQPDTARQARALAGALLVDGPDLPDLADALVLSVETEANIAVGEVAWGLPADLRVGPDTLADGLPAGVPADDALVVQVRDAGRRPEVLALLRSIAASGRPAVVVEWGWPAAYDVGLGRICTRGSSGPGVAAVTEALRGAGWTR